MKRQYPSGSMKRKMKQSKLESRNNNGLMDNFLVREVPVTLSSDIGITSVKEKSPSTSDTMPGELFGANSQRKNSDVAGAFSPLPERVDVSTEKLESSFSENIENSSAVANNTIIDYNDPALWPPITESLRDYFLKCNPNQNIEQLKISKKAFGDQDRFCSASNFFRVKQNGETIKRDWLIFSPSSNSVFCYICKLYSSSDQALCTKGFSDWRNISKRLASHETSTFHRKSVYSFCQRSKAIGRIDCSLVDQYNTECNYWKKVLHRVVAVIKFISARGLPFFGQNETFGSSHNGNFLGILELLSSYDSFLSEHIKAYGNKGKGTVSYLSSTIVEEFIEVLSNRVLEEVLFEVKQAKYFGLIVDSTPDITHTDQLAVVLRYVDKEGNPIERFLKFITIHGHSSEHLEEVIINLLEQLNIELKYCRGQSYDNASNMAGKYSGLQARLKEKFPLIEYVPCSTHSLNLIGTTAAECCPSAVSFFGIIQNLYNFFSVSTHRWELLCQKISSEPKTLTLKSLATTRWSANAEAVKALRQNYANITSILSTISENASETPATRYEGKVLYKKLQSFEFALMLIIWDNILQRMNSVNKTMQSVNCEMAAVVPLYDSLQIFINHVRSNFEMYENEAESLVGTRLYTCKRKRFAAKSKFYGENSDNEVQFSERETFLYQTHYVICDSIITELNKRKAAYSVLESRFGFMCCKTIKKSDLEAAAKQFQKIYSVDIDEEFSDEFLQFSDFLSNDMTIIDKLKQIKSLGIEHTFPNVEIALRILLSIPISNCSSERSFSVLKRIKNRLRSTLSGKNLSGLSLLSIESDLMEKISFDDIIEKFAASKSRKVPF